MSFGGGGCGLFVCLFVCLILSQQIEPMMYPFIHHQLCGESFWTLISYSQRDKLEKLVEVMATTHAKRTKRLNRLSLFGPESDDETPAMTVSTENTRILSKIPFYAKNLLPPYSLLREHGIEFKTILLQSGQVLIASGSFAHFGWTTMRSWTDSHSLASHMVTEEWLQQGGPQFLVQYFKWVQQLQQMEDLDQQLKEYALAPHQLTDALNQCPPLYACSMLRGMTTNLRHHLNPETKCKCVGKYSFNDADTEKYLALLDEAKSLLHEVRPFLINIYVRPLSPPLSYSSLYKVCQCKLDNDIDKPSSKSGRAAVNDINQEARLSESQVEGSSSDHGNIKLIIQMNVQTLGKHPHFDSNQEISKIEYKRVDGTEDRCWYRAVYHALSNLISQSEPLGFWGVHDKIKEAVAAVTNVEIATKIGFPQVIGKTEADCDLAAIRKNFLRGIWFSEAKMATDLEVRLLSLAYDGMLLFLVYRHDDPEPREYRYEGSRPAVVEIALHWCSARISQYSMESEPDHYNLLQYHARIKQEDEVQSMWWIQDETLEHQQARRQLLRSAVHEKYRRKTRLKLRTD